MKITIATVGTRGDVQPYIALGLGLQESGHLVQIATDSTFKDFIEASGLSFAEVKADPRRALQEDTRRIGSNPIRMLRWIDRQFAPLARGYFIDMLAACQDSDAILVSALAFAAMHVAQALGIPYLATYLYPVTPTHAFPSMAASSLPEWLTGVGWVNWLTFRFYNLSFFRMMLPLVNQLRGEILSLPPIPWSYYTHIDLSEVPIIYGYSQHVIPRPPDWGDHLHVTGYWFFDQHGWEPPHDLAYFIESGPPPVYIGFGSMVDAEAQKTTRFVMDALAITGQRAVLHSGWSDLGFKKGSDRFFKVRDIPHNWLFPRMAAVVHHGGAGTSSAALLAGVPSVIVPYFADQPFWARHIYQLGASSKPMPRDKLNAEKLAAAIQESVEGKAIRERARQLGSLIRQEDGIAQAVRLIDRYLSEPQKLMQFNP